MHTTAGPGAEQGQMIIFLCILPPVRAARGHALGVCLWSTEEGQLAPSWRVHLPREMVSKLWPEGSVTVNQGAGPGCHSRCMGQR